VANNDPAAQLATGPIAWIVFTARAAGAETKGNHNVKEVLELRRGLAPVVRQGAWNIN
jgi:hypothetical protein